MDPNKLYIISVDSSVLSHPDFVSQLPKGTKFKSLGEGMYGIDKYLIEGTEEIFSGFDPEVVSFEEVEFKTVV